MHYRAVLILIIMMFALVGCREINTPASAEDVNILVETDPKPPAPGQGRLMIMVTDAEGELVTDAVVRIRGDMTHAGMTPELGESDTSNEAGVYEIPFNWSMAGDWIIDIEVTLPNDEVVERQVEYTLEGDDTSPDMEVDVTAEAEMSGSGANEQTNITAESE